MSELSLGHGLPETVLPPDSDALTDALASAAAAPAAARRAALASVVARWPTASTAWAALGDESSDVIDAYACYRVGYHRGLDQLRHNGWRGSGYVRWQHPSNRGFLRALAGLQRCAAAIGERDEAERCAVFLRQLDPAWDDSLLDQGD
ncbi:MAG: DUF3151 domain-containing protein [Acidimicrobiales bacterium]